MTITLYDTVTRSERPFAPIDPAQIRIYQCGSTVYDHIHLGNARPLVVFDLLHRVLQMHYGNNQVIMVRNITDIDDKIINRAQQLGISTNELTTSLISEFNSICHQLGCLQLQHQPRATEYIPEMLTMIKQLLDHGNAYIADGHVLFAANSYPRYGKLSQRSSEAIRAGARIAPESYKRHHQDFVLWKSAPADQPGWPSPWGYGRPGWHIECSAMARALLGSLFDIHCGGQDLIFPHHENENAQSCCANQVANMANYWLHNGMVNFAGNKMSKSLGNVSTVKAMLEIYPAEAIRLALLQAHYRAPIEITQETLAAARNTLDRWFQCGQLATPATNATNSTNATNATNKQITGKADLATYINPKLLMASISDNGIADKLWRQLQAALANDLNTPHALTVMAELANRCLAGDAKNAPAFAKTLQAGMLLFGFNCIDPNQWFQYRRIGAKFRDKISDETIQSLISQRDQARKAQAYAAADTIRDQLRKQGVVIKDTDQGCRWQRVDDIELP